LCWTSQVIYLFMAELLSFILRRACIHIIPHLF